MLSPRPLTATTTYSRPHRPRFKRLSITNRPSRPHFAMQQQQAFPLQQEPLQQQQQASYPNQLPTQYQQQPPPQQQFYQPAATTSQPNTFYNQQQQQPVYAPAEPAIVVAPDLQNNTSAMQQPAFANSPRQRSQNRSARASLSQQGEYHVTSSGDDRHGGRVASEYGM